MLEELSVKGFGIIEEISWRPGNGLNVITGETGAGKSLVVDAVEALLSAQAREEDIRHGSTEATVEGIFTLAKKEAKGELGALLAEKGLEAEDGALLLSCDFRRQGRTTPRVNRQAVSRSLLKDISAALVDIHGQSEHLSLLDRAIIWTIWMLMRIRWKDATTSGQRPRNCTRWKGKYSRFPAMNRNCPAISNY